MDGFTFNSSFKDGNLKQPVDSNKEDELNENALVENLEIDLDDENDNPEITADDNKIESNEIKFQTDIDSNWLRGGEKPKSELNNLKGSENESTESDGATSDQEVSFEDKIEEAFSQFEDDMNSDNDKEFPVPYWFDIVKTRAEMMKDGARDMDPIEVQHEWTWSHADEYKNKYQSVSKKEATDEISTRIERYGFIYEQLCNLEKAVEDLCKLYAVQSNPFETEHKWTLLSAASSLYGSINFALSIGMSDSEIKGLYASYEYDRELVEGIDPFKKFGMTQEETDQIIKEKLGIDMNDISLPQTQIKKRLVSILAELPLEKRYAIFYILLVIANSDGMTDEENKVLSDASLELDIEIDQFNKFKMDGDMACDNIKEFNQAQKEEFSRLIQNVVGADGQFSSEEMMFVMNVIAESDLDPTLISDLIGKYW